MLPKKRYRYKGPVKKFDMIVDPLWEAETIAKTKKQALNNLSYRYKRQYGFLPNSMIILDKNYIQEVETIDDEGYYGTIEDYIEGRVY